MQRQMENNRRGNQQEENMKEAVFKLTTQNGKHQGMDASPQTHHLPVAMETKGNYGKQWLSCICVHCVFVQGERFCPLYYDI